MSTSGCIFSPLNLALPCGVIWIHGFVRYFLIWTILSTLYILWNSCEPFFLARYITQDDGTNCNPHWRGRAVVARVTTIDLCLMRNHCLGSRITLRTFFKSSSHHFEPRPHSIMLQHLILFNFSLYLGPYQKVQWIPCSSEEVRVNWEDRGVKSSTIDST